MFKKLFNWFKPKKKECFADQDGWNHNMCAMQPSCNKCPCHRFKK
jgi:hypothetical protein